MIEFPAELRHLHPNNRIGAGIIPYRSPEHFNANPLLAHRQAWSRQALRAQIFEQLPQPWRPVELRTGLDSLHQRPARLRIRGGYERVNILWRMHSASLPAYQSIITELLGVVTMGGRVSGAEGPIANRPAG